MVSSGFLVRGIFNPPSAVKNITKPHIHRDARPAADFNALVEDLVAALDAFKVAKADKDQLLAVLGPMQGAIVEKQ